MQKPFNRKLKLGPGLFMRGGNAPYANNLNTLHRIVEDNIWKESKVNLSGGILPRVADFGTDDDIDIPVIPNLVDCSFLFRIKPTIGALSYLLNLDPTVGTGIGILFGAGGNILAQNFGDPSAYQTTSTLTTATKYDVVVIRISGVNTIYVNGVIQATTNAGNVPPLAGNKIGSRNGAVYYSGNIIDTQIYTRAITAGEIINYSNKVEISSSGLFYRSEMTGQGDYEYDISRNNNHGTWSGTGSRHDYDIEGSLYPLQNGLSMYSNIAGDLIRVPYDINGLPLVSPPVPAGYTLRSEHPANVGNFNMFDCKIDFANVGDNPDVYLGWDFTVGWSADGGAIINDNNTFTTSIANRGISEPVGNLTPGKMYQILLLGATTSDKIEIYDAVGGLYASGFGINEFKATSSRLYLRNGTTGVTNITVLSIKEISSELNNLNRSDSTIYNDSARAGSDYDSNKPYQFQIDNLDPRILFGWRNVDHKGMLYAKIFLDANKNLIFMYEFLNYLTDKKDEQEYQVMLYCGYVAIIMVDENGDYKTDDDDYVLIESL